MAPVRVFSTLTSIYLYEVVAREERTAMTARLARVRHPKNRACECVAPSALACYNKQQSCNPGPIAKPFAFFSFSTRFRSVPEPRTVGDSGSPLEWKRDRER